MWIAYCSFGKNSFESSDAYGHLVVKREEAAVDWSSRLVVVKSLLFSPLPRPPHAQTDAHSRALDGGKSVSKNVDNVTVCVASVFQIKFCAHCRGIQIIIRRVLDENLKVRVKSCLYSISSGRDMRALCGGVFTTCCCTEFEQLRMVHFQLTL